MDTADELLRQEKLAWGDALSPQASRFLLPGQGPEIVTGIGRPVLVARFVFIYLFCRRALTGYVTGVGVHSVFGDVQAGLLLCGRDTQDASRFQDEEDDQHGHECPDGNRHGADDLCT